ncbi:MAG TPA: 5'-nucleotidase C-terminal domain-containing protein [Ilumatobacteraceae bacterium]|nr:5'-nucleotidase C-terminal domain-containing protein [Ilumatobacteraceae bacterium]
MRTSLRRKLAIALTSVGLVGGVVVASPASPVHAASQTITLLNVNDFHGRIDSAGDLTTKWATTIEQQRAIDPTGTLLLGAGDLIGASLFNSAVQNDQPTIDVINELCMNASSVGNHEFDKGYTDLTGRVVNGPAGIAPDACPTFGSGSTAAGTNARWAYLGANVYLKGTQTPALPEYTIFTVKGITIGVIGAVTAETPALVSPGGITQIDIGDPVVAVNRVAAKLSDGNPANGEAQVLVAEYHEGAANGALTLSQNVALPAPNPFADIVNLTSPQVDVIFTGHTHQAYVYDAPVVGGSLPTRPVLQTGSYADHVGKVTLTVDDVTGAVTAHLASNLAPATTPDYTLPRVAKVKTIVDAAKAFADTIGLQPIGKQTADITTAFTGGTYTGPGGTYVGSGPTSTTGRDDRSKESTVGDLVANALRDTLAPATLGGAQIGVTNPGGLRAELLYKQVGTEGDGVITYAEANNVLPFVNNLWTTTLTGAQFKTLLEQQWQRDASNNIPTRPYLQLGLSDNVTYTYDDALPEGSRITSITINGAPYNAAASYRIGTFSFLATGGDNFRIFTSGTNTKDSGLVDRDGWISYLTAHSPSSPDFARQSVKVTNLPTAVALAASVQFGVGSLDLTSLGSPANTSLAVSIGGVAVGSVPVANGAATVNLTIPGGVPSGAQTLTAIACPSGTKIAFPVAVSGTTTTTPAPTPAITSCGLQIANPAKRLLDTRVSPTQRTELASGGTVEVKIAGKYGIAADASAVALNLTSVGVTSDGWIRAYPCGTTPTNLTSNLNPVDSRIVANLAIVPLDSSGSVCLQTLTATDLVVDLQGWYPAGSDYHAIQSTRIADTRTATGIATHLTSFAPVELTVAGVNGVAPTASAVAMNLTAVADAAGYITSYPCGTAAPLASNLNAWAGHAIANSAITAIGAGGKVCFVSNIDTDLVVDLEGWYPAGASYHAFSPVRAVDTRDSGVALAPTTVLTVPMTGVHGVPATATTVSLNVTAVNATGPAWVKVFPCGQPAPEVSNNNTSPDRIVATQALVPIGAGGAVCIAANWTTDIVVDVQGWQ